MCYTYDDLSRVTARTVKKLSDKSLKINIYFRPDERNNKTMNKNTRKIIFSLLLFISLCSMLFFNLLSPYEEWDPTVKQIDYDVLGSLVIIWLTIFLCNTVCMLLTKSNKYHLVSFILLDLISLGKLISLLLIYII